MPPKFLAYKSAIDAFLLDFLARNKQELTVVNTWGGEAVRRLSDLATRGKTIRGSLVFFSHDMFGADNRDDLMPFATGIELLHTGLLIHDDIMDHDELRRGLPTLHTQMGTSAAMAAGDLAFFLAIELFTQKSTPVTAQITRYISQEIQKVCIAQMQDVQNKQLSEEETLNLYRYKTARYTFSLPFVVGAMVANASADAHRQLAELGEHLGILFQITDDELNKTGDPTVSGKSQGSDKRQGKKTLSDITKNIDAIIAKEKDAAAVCIDRLPVADTHKTVLRDMLEFVCQRNR